MRLYTYGYDSYPIDKVIAHLVRNGVRHVVDVRYKPFSRNPAYRPGPLRLHLAAARIGYTGMTSLGNVNYKGGPMQLADPSAVHTLRELVELEEGVCILCVCKDVEGCHRRLISDTLESSTDLEVVNL